MYKHRRTQPNKIKPNHIQLNAFNWNYTQSNLTKSNRTQPSTIKHNRTSPLVTYCKQTWPTTGKGKFTQQNTSKCVQMQPHTSFRPISKRNVLELQLLKWFSDNFCSMVFVILISETSSCFKFLFGQTIYIFKLFAFSH